MTKIHFFDTYEMSNTISLSYSIVHNLVEVTVHTACYIYPHIMLHLYHVYILFSAASAIAVTGGAFGPGVGDIHLTGLFCIGDEEYLSNCSVFTTFFSLFCGHFSDVGVLCPRELSLSLSPSIPPPPPPPLSLPLSLSISLYLPPPPPPSLYHTPSLEPRV